MCERCIDKSELNIQTLFWETKVNVMCLVDACVADGS